METTVGADAPKIEIADELVDEASISDGRAIVRFSRTEAALADLQKRFKDAKFDLTTTRGNEAARAARRELTSLRTGLEAKRKSLKSPAVEFGRLIDSQAMALKIEIEALEDPIDAQIKADEQRREDERQAKLAAEQKRCDDHRARIADISAVATRAVGLPSAEIQAKIDLVTRVEIDATFEEFEAAAGNVKFDTLLTLKELHAKALDAEAEAAKVKADRERLAQLERENAERTAREQAEQRQKFEDEQRQRAAEQAEAAARQIQSNLARDLIEEIRVIQARAFTSSAAGMLELVGMIEGIKIGHELGDFEGPAQKAREDALATLHMAHGAAVEREEEKRRIEQAAADLERKQSEWLAAHPPASIPVSIDQAVETPDATGVGYVEFADGQQAQNLVAATPSEERDARIDDTPVDEFIESLPQAMEILGVDVGHEMPAKEDLTGFVRVPVLRNFDQTKQIGELTVLASELPPTPDFLFTIGYMVKQAEIDPANPNTPIISEYELVTASLLQDSDYLRYLQETGQAAAVEPATASKYDTSDTAPMLSTGDIGRRLGLDTALPVATIEGALGVPRSGQEKRAVLWRASQWPAIINALLAHVKGAL